MSNVYRDLNMQEAVKRTVRSLMVKNGETYASLTKKLEMQYGIRHNPLTLKSKINKGTIGAQLYIYVLLALDLQELNLSELENLMLKYKSNFE